MKSSKAPSFTLAELLVVMVITAIVAGLAFAVLDLVQKQVHKINENLDSLTKQTFFEQRLWLDFHTHSSIGFKESHLTMTSDIDTIHYHFTEASVVREGDSLHIIANIKGLYLNGEQKSFGAIDAISLELAQKGLPSSIFVSMKQDASQYINANGF